MTGVCGDPGCPCAAGDRCAVDPAPEQPAESGPTDADLCGAAGHAYYGDDGGHGRCYCGSRSFPPGGWPDDDSGGDHPAIQGIPNTP